MVADPGATKSTRAPATIITAVIAGAGEATIAGTSMMIILHRRRGTTSSRLMLLVNQRMEVLVVAMIDTENGLEVSGGVWGWYGGGLKLCFLAFGLVLDGIAVSSRVDLS